MSLSKSSAVRLSSQVYPVWLPRALGNVERHSAVSHSYNKRKICHLQFAASLQSPLHANSQDKNWAFKPPFPYSINLQQKRYTLRRQSQRRRFSTSPLSPPELHSKKEPKLTWLPPSDVHTRPVTILGAGVIGRRLATLWASTGRPVNIYDPSPAALDSACLYIADSLASFCAENRTHPGHVHFASSLEDAVFNAWMVIEAVPEDLELKISVLGRVDRHTSLDCIIATNSANYRSRELVSEVKNRYRVLNTLYYVPPANRCVELMGCGYTSPAIYGFLKLQMEQVNLKPTVVRHESTGLILPRLFGAIKRECLMELQEGVCQPEDIDELFRDFFGAEKGPCEKMDEVGLDIVAATERHMLDDEEWRKGRNGWSHLRFLEEQYVLRGKLGDKSGMGLIPHQAKEGKESLKKTTAEIWRQHAIDLSGM